MEKEFHIVGQSLPRVDAVAKATGTIHYVDDIQLPGMLYAKVLRSPHAHARIRGINLAQAETLPGVRAIVTGQDTPEKYVTFMLSAKWHDKVLFAREKVRYVGEEVAAVAAVSEEIAEKAVKLIEVEYEPLPAVFTMNEAMAEGAPLIHERLGTNLSNHFEKEIGDVDKAFAKSDVIIEGDYKTPAVSHACMEPHGIVAQFIGEDLHVWMSTQAPHYVMKDIEIVLGIPLANIHIHETAVGGGFGSKSRIGESDLIGILLARKAGKPVKLILSREEEMTVTRTRHPHEIHLKVGAKQDGTILAWEARTKIDNGAYNDVGPNLHDIEGSRVASLYPAPNIRVVGETIYTNTPFGGRFRAYGSTQMTFALESHMEILAEKLGMDPLALRLENAVRPGEKTPWGWDVSSCGLSECLQTVSDKIGPKGRGQGMKQIGIGMAGMTHRSGGSEGEYSSAIVHVRDGEVTLLTGVTEIGQGVATILSQIAAETLGVTADHLRIKTMDTDVTPTDLGSRSNRVTFVGGRAVKAAAEDAREQILKAVEGVLGHPCSELQIKNNEIFWVKDPTVKMSLRAATSTKDPKGAAAILGRGFYDHPIERGECTYIYGSHAVKVAVDEETGEISVLSAAGAHDLGRAINPMLAEGQIEGGMSQGIGFALMEEIVRENGVTLNDNLLDYKLPTMVDIPALQVDLIETDDPYGPYGAKGLGEPTGVPMAPAIANAVYDAVGVKMTDLPMTPEKVLRTIEESKRKKHKEE